MKTTRKLGVKILATTAVIGLLAACGSNGDPGGNGGGETNGGGEANGAEPDPDQSYHAEIGVMLAEGTSGYDFIVGVGDSITAEHPNYTYDYTFVNTRVRPQIEQRWRAGSPPDSDYYVFNAQVPSSHEFIDELLVLDEYLDEELETGGTWRESFSDATAAVTQLDGKTYGVVTDTHIIGLFYNQGMFDELGLTPPSTWDDLLEVSASLAAAGIDPIAVTGMHEPYMGFWLDYLFTREVGYDATFEAVYSGDFSDPGFLRAAEKVQDLRDQGAFLNGFEGTDFTPVQMEFFQGNAGMILMGTWLSSEMADVIPDDFELGVVAFPEVTGGAGDATAGLSHSNIMAVNKNGDNIPAVLEFMRTFTSEEVQTRRSVEQGVVSAVDGVPSPAAINGLDEALAGITELNIRHFGLEYLPDRNTAYYREVAKFFFGEYDAAEFIEAISSEMARLTD